MNRAFGPLSLKADRLKGDGLKPGGPGQIPRRIVDLRPWIFQDQNTEGFGLRDSAETHRRIYDAIRARSPERARREMTGHLERARWEQVAESRSPGERRMWSTVSQ